MNSEKDDIAFILNGNDETQGFIASDRNVSGKQYQIFRVKITGDIESLSQNKPLPVDETESQTIEEIVEDFTKTAVAITEKPEPSDTKAGITKSEESEAKLIQHQTVC